MTLSITTICHYAECRDLFIVMLNVILLSVIMVNVVILSVMLSVIMLSAIILSVEAPIKPISKHILHELLLTPVKSLYVDE